MNNQIKKLAEQAGGEFWQRLENDVVNPRAYITFDPPKSLEKFVESIVQECINVLHDNELWSRDVSHVLKEHFGVEEPPVNDVDRILQTVRTRS